jgi:D-3-phosphoglycerate dehydrogenase
MHRVLISDDLSPRAVEIFRSRGIVAEVRTGLPPAELESLIGEYQGLAIRSATKVTAKLLAKADQLKVIGRAGIGVDNVDVPAATQRGIVVMNTPHGNSVTTAEHAIALMFALARQLPAADHSTQAGTPPKRENGRRRASWASSSPARRSASSAAATSAASSPTALMG